MSLKEGSRDTAYMKVGRVGIGYIESEEENKPALKAAHQSSRSHICHISPYRIPIGVRNSIAGFELGGNKGILVFSIVNPHIYACIWRRDSGQEVVECQMEHQDSLEDSFFLLVGQILEIAYVWGHISILLGMSDYARKSHLQKVWTMFQLCCGGKNPFRVA